VSKHSLRPKRAKSPIAKKPTEVKPIVEPQVVELAVVDGSPPNPLGRPFTWEEMSPAERWKILKRRRQQMARPEWGRTPEGDLRPKSAWDRFYD
jgi:hypothetical protein